MAKRRVGGQRQQVAGHVEGAGAERALVGLGLQRLGARDAAAQQFKNRGGNALVGAEKILDGLGVKLRRSGVFSKTRKIPAGFEEVLVARGALLAVPARLVDEHDGGQQAEPLDGKGDVGQVGDGAMAVLKIKGIQELLGALGADFGQGLAHGERRAGVFGHGEGEDLGIGAMDGENFRLRAGARRQKRFTGHEDRLADRIRHRACCSLWRLQR